MISPINQLYVLLSTTHNIDNECFKSSPSEINCIKPTITIARITTLQMTVSDTFI